MGSKERVFMPGNSVQEVRARLSIQPSDEYTPRDEEVRDWAASGYLHFGHRRFLDTAGFDRWLAAHDAALAVPAGKAEAEKWQREVAEGLDYVIPETGEIAPADLIVTAFKEARWKARDYDELMDREEDQSGKAKGPSNHPELAEVTPEMDAAWSRFRAQLPDGYPAPFNNWRRGWTDALVGKAGQVYRDAIAEIIWKTSRADEGSISATGANIIADALLAAFPALTVEADKEGN